MCIRDRVIEPPLRHLAQEVVEDDGELRGGYVQGNDRGAVFPALVHPLQVSGIGHVLRVHPLTLGNPCLLYTSDAADDLLCVDLGGRRIIKKKKKNKKKKI